MILIDTHVVVWMTQEPTLLSKVAAQAVVESRVQGGVAMADISFRELAFLVTRGRISINKPLKVYFRFIESIFQILPIDGRVAERSLQFGNSFPNDPSDQIIAATAIVHGLQLVTKDVGIRRSGEVPCVW